MLDRIDFNTALAHFNTAFVNFNTALADFNIYQKRNKKNILISIQSLMCDCAIALEMKIGSVQFSHFKSFSTSLLLVLCNSFSAEIVFDTYLQISAAHTID